MGVEIIVPLALFTMVAAIVLGPLYLKSRERREMQETVRYALDKGQPLPPELVEAIAKAAHRPAPAVRDLRMGVILLALAGGVFACFWSLGTMFGEEGFGFAAFAAIPGFIGAAFVLLSFFNKTKD